MPANEWVSEKARDVLDAKCVGHEAHILVREAACVECSTKAIAAALEEDQRRKRTDVMLASILGKKQ